MTDVSLGRKAWLALSPHLYRAGRAKPIHHGVLTGLSVLTRAIATFDEPWVRWKTYTTPFVRLGEGARLSAVRQGVRLDLNLSGNLERCLYFTGTYEAEYLRFLRSELRAGETYIDVGGHIGLDAFVVAKRMGRGRIICFEPSPDSAQAIRRCADVNGFGFIQVVEAGLANENGTLQLRSDPDWLPGDSAVRSRYNAGDVVVEATLLRFDDWAQETGLDRMDVVKLDIEGGEYEALVGMRDSLRRLRPRCVIVEVGVTRLAQAGSTADMIDGVLAEVGYRRSGEEFLENVVYRR